MTESQNDPVIQRLDRLERENWYWKRATLLLLIVIGTAIFIGLKPKLQKAELMEALKMEAATIETLGIKAGVVTTQEIHIVDDQGKTRAELRYDDVTNRGTVSLELRAKNTGTIAALYVDDES